MEAVSGKFFSDFGLINVNALVSSAYFLERERERERDAG
jgi:hypothetical protein